MSKEYEIVSHSQLQYKNIFLVRLVSRTTPKEYRKLAAMPKKTAVSSLESSQYFFTQQDSYLLLISLRNQLLEKMRQVALASVHGPREGNDSTGREDR